MATTVHEPPKTGKEQSASRLAPSDNGGWHNLVPTDGELQSVEKYSPPPASTGIWVGIAAIGMTFAAFTSALIVRKGSSTDWQSFTLPWILYLNTVVLLASSLTLEMSRRRVAAFMGGLKQQVAHPARWLYVTFLLGLVFVAGQYIAWRQLRTQGIFLATNPSSSFFYLLTAIHALHVGGGLGGLILVIRRLSRSVLRRSTLDTASLYWHFMDVLWIYLLVLLWMKL
jgi:cytochrome c oxidase subunit 3